MMKKKGEKEENGEKGEMSNVHKEKCDFDRGGRGKNTLFLEIYIYPQQVRDVLISSEIERSSHIYYRASKWPDKSTTSYDMLDLKVI